MILVDTSIWVDHFRAEDTVLVGLLYAGRVLIHPFVIGELALGRFLHREERLVDLQDLPQAMIVSTREVLYFVDRHRLFGRGIGYVDTHLLAAARLTLGATLWTRDRRLLAVADQLGLASTH